MQLERDDWRAVVESDRIAQLKVSLDSGAAPSAFWSEIERTGTPLVEEIAGDADSVSVTFLLRAEAASGYWTLCEGIALGATFGAGERFQLKNIPETDIWHISLRLPRSTRVTYGFSPHRESPHALADDYDWASHFAALRSDPYNPKSFYLPPNPEWPGPRGRTVSLLELPDAPHQTWIVPAGRRSGTTTLHSVASSVLGRTIQVYVYSPHEHARVEPSPLVVLFDGWDMVHIASITTVLDNLIAAGEIPPVVAVMPESGTHRTRDLVFCDDFCSFITEELAGWARQEWGAGSRAGTNVIGGGSAGGLAALYTAFRRPDVFGNVISQLGAVGVPRDGEPEWISQQYAGSPRLQLKIYLEAGLLDNDPLPGVPPILESNRRLRDVLLQNGYDLTYRENACGHDRMCLRETIAHALIELLPGLN